MADPIDQELEIQTARRHIHVVAAELMAFLRPLLQDECLVTLVIRAPGHDDETIICTDEQELGEFARVIEHMRANAEPLNTAPPVAQPSKAM